MAAEACPSIRCTAFTLAPGDTARLAGCVPKLVRHEPLWSHGLGGPVEARSAEDPVAQYSPGPQAGEDQIPGSPACQLFA